MPRNLPSLGQTSPASGQALPESVRFAELARCLADTARAAALLVPAFRSPPRIEGVDRTIKRSANGDVTISVRVRNRPSAAVVADMIDGIVVANQLPDLTAAAARAALWACVEGILLEHSHSGRRGPVLLPTPLAS